MTGQQNQEEEPWRPSPPHDCRLTARCFRESFSFRFERPYDFAELRDQNSAIDTFFERRQNDPAGGEGGERIKKISSHPAFSLHLGRMRGATWFEKDTPPQGVVWLLSVEPHDDRKKGRDDAYDRFANQESKGVLFPVDVDYKLLELFRRRQDTATFETQARADAGELLAQVLADGRADGTLADVPTRMALTADDDPMIVAVALSQKPIIGRSSGYEIPLTDQRFLLFAAIVESVAQQLAGQALTEAPHFDFPGGFSNERGFLVAFPRPS